MTPPSGTLEDRVTRVEYSHQSLSGQIAAAGAVNLVHGEVLALRGEVRDGFAAVDARFDAIDANFEAMNARQDAMEALLRQVLDRLPE